MNQKRVLFRLSALALILLVSGCVFMRLYKVQNQFQDFDKNFELGDEGGVERPVQSRHEALGEVPAQADAGVAEVAALVKHPPAR